MDRASLILRVRRFAPEAAFALLLAGAVMAGGAEALGGAPKLLGAILPGMAAQAQPQPQNKAKTEDTTRLALDGGFAPSRYSPQVLYPVAGRGMPDWLVQAMRAEGAATASAAAAPLTGKPVIAICIDDLGEDIAGTDRALLLPRQVALSFLPYAEDTPFLAEAATKRGHLVLAHVPMQALRATNPGPMALSTGMAAGEIARRLAWNIARVPGLSGINNHEGSRFTADAGALAPVARMLAEKKLFFFDSRTGPDSKVVMVARAMGVPSAGRDIFLDDVPGEAEVIAQLDALVREAKRSGVAIAIGHPRDATLTVLSRWLARDHGVTLVPLDEAMRLKAGLARVLAAR